MTRVVYKYRLEPGMFMSNRTTLKLPPRAKFVLFDFQQDGGWHVWFEVPKVQDPGFLREREFVIYATGEEINHDNHEHVSSFQEVDPDAGPLVWHLYEVVR